MQLDSPETPPSQSRGGCAHGPDVGRDQSALAAGACGSFIRCFMALRGGGGGGKPPGGGYSKMSYSMRKNSGTC